MIIINKYRLATISHRGFTFPVIEIEGKLVSINQGYEYYKENTDSRDLFKSKHNYTMLDIMEEWDLFGDMFTKMVEFFVPILNEELEFIYETEDVKFLPPLLYPGKVLNAGANYYDHVLEMGPAVPEKEGHEPYFFYKGRNQTIIGHGDSIKLTPHSNYVDWEAELAVVIGKTTKNVSVENAMDYIAGYTCYNDISARDRMRRKNETFDYDWFANKGNDTSGPLGPYIVPSKFVSDPNNLEVHLYLNGDLMQDTNTNLMIWDIAELVSTASSVTTLSPGDIIATGTGAGVGMGKGIKVKYNEMHKVFEHMYAGKSILLKPGDKLKIEIAEIGCLENDVVDYK